MDQSARWDLNIRALDKYVQRVGDALVPIGHREGKVSLGTWVGYQRTRYRQGKLAAWRVSLLEGYAGWEWGPLSPGPRQDLTLKDRDTKIYVLAESGLSLAKIGDKYGLTRQRVHQIVRTQ
jgi:hypothetical protein